MHFFTTFFYRILLACLFLIFFALLFFFKNTFFKFQSSSSVNNFQFFYCLLIPSITDGKRGSHFNDDVPSRPLFFSPVFHKWALYGSLLEAHKGLRDLTDSTVIFAVSHQCQSFCSTETDVYHFFVTF